MNQPPFLGLASNGSPASRRQGSRPCKRAHPWRSLGLLAVLLLAAPEPAHAKTWDSPQHNAQLEIPENWNWDNDDPAFAKYGIVKSARRVLEKLRGGVAADGEGALLQLAKWDAPEGKDLAALGDDAKVREFLLQRMKATGDVEVEESTVPVVTNDEARQPALILRAKGEGNNLKGKSSLCMGAMVITLCKGKLYLVRMYAWPASEYDEEGVGVDIDFMEGNAFFLLDNKEEAKPTDKPAEKPPEDDEGGEEELTEEMFDNIAQGWRIVKHKKLTSLAIEEGDGENAVLKFAGSDTNGGYQLIFYAIPNSRIVDGVQQSAPDLRSWMTTDWWKYFHITHAQGEIATWKWPRKTENKTFLTFPDLADEDDKIVIFKEGEKREIEPKPSDFEKWKAVEKPRVDNIGPKGKASEAMRGILRGNRERYGVETVLRFAWRYRMYSYRLIVTVYGKAHMKWGDALKATLESMEFGIKD